MRFLQSLRAELQMEGKSSTKIRIGDGSVARRNVPLYNRCLYGNGMRDTLLPVRPLRPLQEMNYDYSNRGYLLPKGCKDLIDVLKLTQPHVPLDQIQKQPVPLPPIVGEILIPVPTSVRRLATLLHQSPFTIIADLMEIGIFATSEQHLDLNTVSKVARKYGYTAKRAA